MGLDLETTGVDTSEARIVTAGIVMVGGGLAPEVCDLLADPGIEIPEEATAIHGITTEFAREHGAPATEVLAALVAMLTTCVSAGYPLVVKNCPYDLTVVDRELRRHDVAGLEVLPRLRVIDPQVLDRHLDQYRPGKRTLTALCELYKIELADAHNAHCDALAACRLAWILGKHGEVRRRGFQERIELQAEWERVREDLDALHEFQRDLALAAQAHLEEYFHRGNAKKGVPPQPDRTVPRGWPLIPLAVEATC